MKVFKILALFSNRLIKADMSRTPSLYLVSPSESDEISALLAQPDLMPTIPFPGAYVVSGVMDSQFLVWALNSRMALGMATYYLNRTLPPALLPSAGKLTAQPYFDARHGALTETGSFAHCLTCGQNDRGMTIRDLFGTSESRTLVQAFVLQAGKWAGTKRLCLSEEILVHCEKGLNNVYLHCPQKQKKVPQSGKRQRLALFSPRGAR